MTRHSPHHPIQPPAVVPGGVPHDDLDMMLLGRRPPRLSEATERAVAAAPVPFGHDPSHGGPPAASIVVVSYDNLVLTKLCVAAVLATAHETPFELVVVDNHSTDGTVDYLREVERGNSGVRAIFNDTNLGFAAANNAGLAAATGETFVLLNNDTVPPPGWLGRLVRHLADPVVGLAGPVTNRIGNEAEIETAYRTYGEMVAMAEARSRRYRGAAFDIPVPCMFCLAMRRDVYEAVGPLDERFEVGMLEDDDYARRARAAGYRMVCAEDTFVHHFGQGSFGKLVPSGEYMRLLEANQRRYHEKWGEPWKPYGKRPAPRYEGVVARVREVVRQSVPAGAAAAVISRGDEALVDLDGRSGLHFPQDERGAYAGCYPADGAAAVAHLEALKKKGARFLVVPATGMWWLDHYVEFAEHLLGRHRVVVHEPDVLVVDLGPGGRSRE